MSINVMAFIHIFTLETWILVFVCIIAVALLSAKIAQELASKDRNKAQHFLYGMNEAYMSFIQKCSYVRQDYPGYSGMMLFLVTSLFGFVAFTYYVADLTASMTVSKEVARPRNFQV